MNLEGVVPMNKPVTERHIPYDSVREVPRVVKFVGTESRRVAARGWGLGAGELVFGGDSFSFASWKELWRWLVARQCE